MKSLLAGVSLLGTLGCGPVYCVARGAKVRVPGGTRPIEELVDGDVVLCVEPESGKSTAATIFAVRQSRRECVRLLVDGTALTVTSDHPVYCPVTKSWADAGDWAVGKRTQLLRVQEGRVESVKVTGVSTDAGVFDVFDITVDHPLHNFVADGILVHNKQPYLECPKECTVNGLLHAQGAACTCADGPDGYAECQRDSGPFCAGCKGSIVGSPDAGTGDAGSPFPGRLYQCK
jgi:hypothetical protein